MSAERELERASQEFWLATGGVRERAVKLADGCDWDANTCGYAYLVARAEEHYGQLDGVRIDTLDIRAFQDCGQWSIACTGDTWSVVSERHVWSKDSRAYETVSQDMMFDAFGQAFEHVVGQTQDQLSDRMDDL